MKSKKLVLALTLTVVIGTMATTAFASQNHSPINPAISANNTAQFNKVTLEEYRNADANSGKEKFSFNMDDLTEEQKTEIEARKAEMAAKMAEMEANRAASQEKWNSLTDEQKEEIYSLHDKSIDSNIQIIDKYLEYGLITQGEAAVMKENLENCKARMREDGNMPFLGDKGSRIC